MSDDLQHLVTRHYGEKAYLPFSDDEMRRRQTAIRAQMAAVVSDVSALGTH